MASRDAGQDPPALSEKENNGEAFDAVLASLTANLPELDAALAAKPGANRSGGFATARDHMEYGKLIQKEGREAISQICHRAWLQGLMPGFSGNASLRLGENCLITRSGAAKGNLRESDFALLHIPSGSPLNEIRASSECSMHLEIYRNQPQAMAVLHVHAPKLLALSLREPALDIQEKLNLPLFESGTIIPRLGSAPALEPGTQDLAKAVGLKARQFQAVLMERHGAAFWGADLFQALALAEELEHLAGIRLLI